MQRILEEVKADVKHLKHAVVVVKPELSPGTIFDAFTFPVNSDDDVNKLSALLTDQHSFEKAVHDLMKIGGNNPYDFIYRVTRQIITNRYGSEYSWFGKKQKKVLKTTIIGKLLENSTLKQFPSLTVKEFEQNAMKWSRRCKERI